MSSKTIIALSVAIGLAAVSAAAALEGRDGDNNPTPGARGVTRQQAPVIPGAHIFAGPGFAFRGDVRPAGNNWDRCVRSARQTCVH